MKRIGSAPAPAALVGHWTERAACGPDDTADFYPEGGQHQVAAANAAAKTLCNRCPVRAECLAWAADNSEEWGTWGGLTAGERTALQPQHRRASTGGGRRLAPCGTPAAYERHRANGEPIDDACWNNRDRRKQKKETAT